MLSEVSLLCKYVWLDSSDIPCRRENADMPIASLWKWVKLMPLAKRRSGAFDLRSHDRNQLQSLPGLQLCPFSTVWNRKYLFGSNIRFTAPYTRMRTESDIDPPPFTQSDVFVHLWWYGTNTNTFTPLKLKISSLNSFNLLFSEGQTISTKVQKLSHGSADISTSYGTITDGLTHLNS